MKFVKALFGIAPTPNFANEVKEGAIILDVRNPSEFKNNHIKGAINIPLYELQERSYELKKDKTIITCCASGIRSFTAKRVLQSNGFETVYNGGGWSKLRNKLNQSV